MSLKDAVNSMNTVPPDASDDEILGIVRYWVDMLAAEEYATVFDALGYALLYQWDVPGPQCIEQLIKRYRSPEFFPGVESFRVTDWRTAKGGNPKPETHVTRYKPNWVRLRGDVAFDLPLNGVDLH